MNGLPDLTDRTVWIIGKGPSLEEYVKATVVHPRVDPRAVVVGINQVPTLVDCDYGFANDVPMVAQMAGEYGRDCIPVLPWHARSDYAQGSGATDDTLREGVIWYDATSVKTGGWDEKGFILHSGERLRLVHYLGTPLTAMQWARVCGCRKVVLVGLDGHGGYTRKWGNSAPPDCEVGAIRAGVMEYAWNHGMKVEDCVKEKEEPSDETL